MAAQMIDVDWTEKPFASGNVKSSSGSSAASSTGRGMCYVIITTSSLGWFMMTLFTTMLLVSALVSPKWLIGAGSYELTEYNFTFIRNPSVGINTRCLLMQSPKRTHCGRFDHDGFATTSDVFPGPWKAALFFQGVAVSVMIVTVLFTLVTCCRQSVLGKSIHNCTGSAQVVAGICAMLTIFCHMLGWGALRVRRLCGGDAGPFYPGDCSVGGTMYCAIIAVILSFACAGISLKAETANMRSHVRRRIEGGERLVIVA